MRTLISLFSVVALLVAVGLVAQVTLPNAVPTPTPMVQYLNAAGQPLSGAYLCTFAAGTTTPLATYTDSTAATANTNPVVLDANGRAAVWIGPQLYKFVLYVGGNGACPGTGAVQWSQDNVTDTTLYFTNFVKTAGTATLISYTPPGGPATTVAQQLTNLGCVVGENLYVVGSSCYANIPATITAAGAAGWVLIPKTYTGSESYATGNKNVIDLRSNFFGVYQFIAPSRPITNYPLGNDLALDADGSADLWITHDALGNARATTTTSISAGTQNITISSTANFTTYAGIVVGRGQTNQEICSLNSIPNATTLNITCALSHSGTTDIEQLGNTVLSGGYSISLNPAQPSQLSAYHMPTVFGGQFQWLFTVPQASTDPFPYNCFTFFTPITGGHSPGASNNLPTPGDLEFRNASTSTGIALQTSTGNSTFYFTDNNIAISTELQPQPSGLRTLGDSSHVWNSIWIGSSGTGGTSVLSAAASGNNTMVMPDGNSQTVLTARLVTTASTSDRITIQGLSMGGHCVYSPHSSQADMTTSWGSIPLANTFQLNHAATAGMGYDILCTGN